MGKSNQSAPQISPNLSRRTSSPKGSLFRKYELGATNRPVIELVRLRESDEMEVNPPYQRGSVWGEERKRNLIKSMLMGVPTGAIVVNERGMSNEIWLYLVDGKQRLEAVADFLDSKFTVPAEWFGDDLIENPGKEDVVFDDLTDIGKRYWRHSVTIPVCKAKLRDDEHSTAEDKERELFDLINFGGVPQGESDLDSEDGKNANG